MRFGTPVAAGPPSGTTPGLVMADMLRPSPTSCAVLDDGEVAAVPGLEPLGKDRSVVQYLTRWTELSKLLYILRSITD